MRKKMGLLKRGREGWRVREITELSQMAKVPPGLRRRKASFTMLVVA